MKTLFLFLTTMATFFTNSIDKIIIEAGFSLNKMRIQIITLISLLHFFTVYSQSEIDIYEAMYGNVFQVTLSFSDSETGRLLETGAPEPMEFISGTNGIVIGKKSMLHNDVFYFVEDYYNLVEEKLIFTSEPFMPQAVESEPIESEPLIKGREFSLDPASTPQNLIWTTQATIKGKSVQMSYHMKPHAEYTSDKTNEFNLVCTWRISSVSQGDRTENIDEETDNAILQINGDQSYTGFDTSGYYILSGSERFLILDSQKNTNEIEVMLVAMSDENTLELTKTNDYRNTIMKFKRVK